MKKSWIPRAAFVALMLLVATPLAFADIPSPEKRNTNSASNSELKTEMRISTDEKANQAKLIIPRSIFQQMRAQADDNNSQTATASTRFFNMTGGQTIMSGIFLSLAFAFGGVWLMRTRGNRTATRARAASLVIGLLLIAGVTAGVAYANAGPPPVARSLTSKILIPQLQWWGAYGEVKVEIIDDDRERGIELVLPRRKTTDADMRETE
jgi:hypothetical protein